MNHLLADARAASKAGPYHAALALTLAVPDICGKAETPTAQVGARYRRWYATHMLPLYTSDTGPNAGTVWLSADDCYALRNAFLHQGELALAAASAALERVHIVVPPPGWTLHRNKRDKVVMLQLDIFCEDMCAAAERWFTAAPPEVQARIAALPQIEVFDASKGVVF